MDMRAKGVAVGIALTPKIPTLDGNDAGIPSGKQEYSTEGGSGDR